MSRVSQSSRGVVLVSPVVSTPRPSRRLRRRLRRGLLHPSAGQVSYEGQPVRRPRSDIAFVFQDYGKALLPWRNAAQNVSLALEAIGMPRPARGKRIEELLTKVGLAGHAEKLPRELSGGCSSGCRSPGAWHSGARRRW